MNYIATPIVRITTIFKNKVSLVVCMRAWGILLVILFSNVVVAQYWDYLDTVPKEGRDNITNRDMISDKELNNSDYDANGRIVATDPPDKSPEVDDEVIVIFEEGDPDDTPANEIVMDDTSGGGKINE
jgi:hypothetical protein